MPIPSQYTFDPGVDLSMFDGYATALLQAFQLCTPNTEHGIVYYGPTQPPTTGSPSGSYPANWYAFNSRGLWVKSSTGETYSYKAGVGFINVASLIPSDTITGAMVKDNTITLAKINVPPGTTAGFVPMVNAGGTALQYADVVAGRVDGSIPVAKLAPGANLQFLRTIGSNVSWDTFDGTDINALLAVTKLQPTYIAPGAPYSILATDGTANFTNFYGINEIVQQNSLDVQKLAVPTGGSSKLLGVNSTGTGWEMVATPSTTVLSKAWTSAVLTISDQVVSHNTGTTPIATVPVMDRIVLVCATADVGYSVNDELPVNQTICDYSGTDDDGPWLSVTADATNYTIKVWSSLGASGQVRVINKSTGNKDSFLTIANWRLKIYAFAP